VTTFVYVDGFNLYNRALAGTPYKWLDLPALCDRVLGHRVEHVRYFTARIIARQNDPQQPQRQQAYLRAVDVDPRLTIHYGSFKRREKTGLLVRPKPEKRTLAVISTFEEKGSDVNMAAHALADGYGGRASTVVLLTNDSDLAEPARLLQARGTPVGVIIPAEGLKPKTVPADFYRTLRAADLAACQLPLQLLDSEGRIIRKPASWPSPPTRSGP